MKIAQVAPLFESIPPSLYGGTERIVAYLVEALVDAGHEVTLFASGDSRTKANLISCRDQAIWVDKQSLKSENAAHLSLLDEVRKRAHEFDILHFHVDLLPCPMFEQMANKTLMTMHGRLDLADLADFYQRWPQYPLVSISDNQRSPLINANWAGTVHHGLPLSHFQPSAAPDNNYLTFIGRLAPEKRPHIALNLAQRIGKHMKLAGKLEPHNTAYFHEQIEPMLNKPGIEFLGELGDRDKNGLLGNAEALIFPIDWPEPFGIVMIEAMACGTPVIAWNCGSVPEVIEQGVTGFIVNNEDEAAKAVHRLHELDRKKIRAEFENRFTARAMAEKYTRIYEQLYQKQKTSIVTERSSSGASAHTKSASNVTATPENAAASAAMTTDVSSTSIVSDTHETITVESEESTLPYQLLALKHMDTFVVANTLGDIIGKGDGLFRNDTRVLSNFRLLMGGKSLSLLSATISQDDVFFGAHITNRPLPPLGESSIPEGIIHIERTRFLWQERLYERIQLVNYGERPVSAPLEIHFDADFRDIFEVRGMQRKARGEGLPAEIYDDHVVLSYRGLDDTLRNSVVAFSQQPQRLTSHCAEFLFSLQRKQCTELYIEIGPVYKNAVNRTRFRQAAAKARRSMRQWHKGAGILHSVEHIFNGWLEKSCSDIALLTTDLPTGPYPYAGIPWFSTPFGRDAVITALQMLWFDPRIARGVLGFLAHNQSKESSSFRDAAPGKIMHETRKGEMSLLTEVPFGLYYGGVDTTPLFVMLAGAYAERTADMTFIDEIWPALEAAVAWMETNGDSMDGFLSYESGEATGLKNQGWKDSEDSVFHADGEFPNGAITLVEVQGYKFAALGAMAKLTSYRGDRNSARHWRTRADTIRAAVERRFWMEESGFYALALDGAGQPCRVRTSNAGHLLFAGLPMPERASRVIQQLLSSSFDSGWGIRTLAIDEVRYNPMSYHNGSVWPHDTAICAAGMARYGERAGAAHILSELFGAAVHFGVRLPELFCGFQRFPGEAPIAYPVACLPQAWSSGAVFMTLQACLGLSVDGWRKEIRINRPELPHGINHFAIKGLRVGDARVNVIFQRIRDRVTVFTEGDNPDEVTVLTYV